MLFVGISGTLATLDGTGVGTGVVPVGVGVDPVDIGVRDEDVLSPPSPPDDPDGCC